MRPLRNISAAPKGKGPFAFSRNCSSKQPSTHQFFNPSYIPPRDLVRADELGHRSNNSSNKNANSRSIFKYVAPALSVTKNYVIFDSNYNNNSTNNNTNTKNQITISSLDHNLNLNSKEQYDSDKLILRKLKSQNNKNSHFNISVHQINNHHTILNIRRANSSNVKQISIPNRLYSTDTLQRELQDLHIDEEDKSTPAVSTPPTPPLSFDEIIEPYINPKDPLQSQFSLIENLIKLNKFNEVLPLFHRMRNNGIIPNLDIYTKTLYSISMRNTDETLEIKLTHLLNTYSDMLSNNLKPNNEVYEIIINELLKGSLSSYQSSNFKNGYEFFKIALDLFLINERTNSLNTFTNNQIYINLITCLNYYKIENNVTARDLFKSIRGKINVKNLSVFYSQIMKFALISNDLPFVEQLYNEEIKGIKLDSDIDIDTDLIYQTLIESYNLSSNFDKASLMLDTVLNNIPFKTTSESQNLISIYLSKYMKSLSLQNPHLAYKMLDKFNNVEWLPMLNIDSLMFLSYSYLKQNDLTMSLKIWNLIISRDDFDFNHLQMSIICDDYSIYTSNFIQSFYQIILNTGDKNLIFKATREILIFDSLKLSDVTLIHYIQYLNSIKEHGLVVKLIINQGYKKIMNTTVDSNNKVMVSLNNYLSMMVDILPTSQLSTLFHSTFFKRVVEEYRLLTDNIYGIMKTITKVAESESESSLKKLQYYAKVINYELNDVDNTYVQIPPEIETFKTKLQTFIQ